MIESISVKNYKAFKDATFDIKPITILLGENSVGKSSFLQLLMLLKQTAAVSMFNENSPLKLYGYFAKMGLPENLFRNKDFSKPMKISVNFSNDKIQDKLSKSLQDYINTVKNIALFLPIKGLLEWTIKNADKPITRDSFISLVHIIVNVLNKESLEKYKANLEYAVTRNSLLSIWDINNLTENNLMSVYDMLSNLQKIAKGNSKYSIAFSFDFSNKKLIITKVSVEIKGNTVFSLEKQSSSNFSISSSLSELSEQAIKSITTSFRQSKPIFECFEYPYNKTESKHATAMSNYLLKTVETILKGLKDEFAITMINHVGPLRASPKRYYVLDKENYSTYFDFSNGEAIVEVLKNEDGLREKTNEWLKRLHVKVKIEESEDVINHLLVTQNNLSFDIPDVGFGISQILPIIVQGYLAKPFSLTIIEQPEIHLHPKMQADLANLFSDIVSYKDKNLIIESHSEYMLRRLRLLMADPNDQYKINPSDVAIYYFEGMDLNNGKDYVSVRPLPISDTGFFEWPKSFYETEMKDNIDFMKFQKQ